ncbi:MAG: leucine-rich repeat protein [Bacteroides sp.]|nr:leucine-rich repeat protein [Bacteroides sp.]
MVAGHARTVNDGDDAARQVDVVPGLRPSGLAERYGYVAGASVVRIPAAVTAIPDFCFAGIGGLRRVEFEPGSRCVSVGAYAFAECGELEEVIMPAGITQIKEGAFREARSLRRLAVPQGVTALPKEMCLRCGALEEVTLPKGLVKIGSFALAGCQRLKSIVMPSGVREIGSNAFTGDESLQEVRLPANLTTLESYAFAGCTSLRRIVLPANSNLLGELILSDTPSLEEIVAASPVPPKFDCESFLLEPDDEAGYRRIRLVVPSAAAAVRYRSAHAWRLFRNITPAPPIR